MQVVLLPAGGVFADVARGIVVAGPRVGYIFLLAACISDCLLVDRLAMVQAGEFQKLLIEYDLNIKLIILELCPSQTTRLKVHYL